MAQSVDQLVVSHFNLLSSNFLEFPTFFRRQFNWAKEKKKRGAFFFLGSVIGDDANED